MHPYGVEWLARTRLAELAAEAERARLARPLSWRRSARRGPGIPEVIRGRIDRRRLRDVAC